METPPCISSMSSEQKEALLTDAQWLTENILKEYHIVNKTLFVFFYFVIDTYEKTAAQAKLWSFHLFSDGPQFGWLYCWLYWGLHCLRQLCSLTLEPWQCRHPELCWRWDETHTHTHYLGHKYFQQYFSLSSLRLIYIYCIYLLPWQSIS